MFAPWENFTYRGTATAGRAPMSLYECPDCLALVREDGRFGHWSWHDMMDERERDRREEA